MLNSSLEQPHSKLSSMRKGLFHESWLLDGWNCREGLRYLGSEVMVPRGHFGLESGEKVDGEDLNRC
jgi:hypothetical protein